ncbi:MAG TPA: methylmalonyl Co-A mutase-associated GTPase MeaB, partial [Magnetospirillaceae bacterium]|nr:methylmalonyl Co-A mutase-associated GTPase MeaB [Magnetospirillaceae bacterium]
AELLPDAGKSVRVGISGIPGAGKSTFIEAFGGHLIEQGHKVAVLAVDPSSPRSGGSLLGDKTRMDRLSRDERAFIRPTPTGGSLGGVARRTRDAILLCEAAGFDVILVETVGVGQSEFAVADMVDMFLLLLVPGGGDELQGLKKGIVEIADAVVVNKADGDLAAAADRAVRDYRNALHLLRGASGDWTVPVLRCSALTGEGIGEVAKAVRIFADTMKKVGAFEAKRSDQSLRWLWQEVSEELLTRFRADPYVTERSAALEQAVQAGRMTPAMAAENLLKGFLDRTRQNCINGEREAGSELFG